MPQMQGAGEPVRRRLRHLRHGSGHQALGHRPGGVNRVGSWLCALGFGPSKGGPWTLIIVFLLFFGGSDRLAPLHALSGIAACPASRGTCASSSPAPGAPGTSGRWSRSRSRASEPAMTCCSPRRTPRGRTSHAPNSPSPASTTRRPRRSTRSGPACRGRARGARPDRHQRDLRGRVRPLRLSRHARADPSLAARRDPARAVEFASLLAAEVVGVPVVDGRALPRGPRSATAARPPPPT